MDYKDYIKAGNKVLYVPYFDSMWDAYWNDVKPMVVTIGQYRPYDTDGSMPDPKPEEYDGYHQVEVEENLPDCQLKLARLFPIEQKEDKVLYEGKVYEVYGYSTGSGECDYDEDTDYCILKDGDELKVVEEDDVCSPRSIEELSHDELMTLWGDIRRGSMYTDDYRNTVDVPDDAAMQAWEDFYNELYEEYGEAHADEHDTAEEFADYCDAIEFEQAA